ncbi:MAG: ATP-binding protein [Chloroflexota bacterium]
MTWRWINLDALLAVAVVTAISLLIGVIEAFTRISNISNLYIIGIAGLAARRGLFPAVFASVLAFLAFDWFFIPPAHVFTVDDPSEYLALLTLLVTGIVISRLLTLVQRRAAEAQARQRETQLLYEVSQSALTSARIDEVFGLALERLNDTMGLTWSRLLVRGDREGTLRLVAASGQPPEIPDEPRWLQRLLEEGELLAVCQLPQNVRVLQSRAVEKALTSMSGRVCQVYVPLRLESRVEGVLVVGEKKAGEFGETEDRDLLLAFANQLAIAVQRDALAEQEARSRAIQESDRLKSALISSVSHELKTPLAAIKASVTSLSANGENPAVQLELKESINRETDRLTRLVSNLLDMSRLEAGAVHPKLELTSMADVISDALDRLEPVTHGRHVDVQLAEPLPPTWIDFVLVGQVLANLLDNAIRYSPPEAPISVSAEVVRDQVRLTVFNEGSHIPGVELERLFDKFYRLGNDTGGSGLGLAIARGIVEALGGRIWAENVGHRGVAFTFTLPAVTETSAGSPAPPWPVELRT